MKPKSTPKRAPKKTDAMVVVRPAVPVLAAGASFPIVGIGASAGGLEALEQFLAHVPPASGMAFIVVQHLDPTYKGILAELLQRATSMKVMQVKDRTKVQPDSVYVIPPNKDLSILHGTLYLLAPVAPRGLRLPIDYFFRSLAQDQQEHSVGVILSGMGSDGTLGLRAIKEKAGVVLVQDPASAKFDGMPRSAVDAGLADIVAPADELPEKILAFLRRTPLLPRAELMVDEKMQGVLQKVIVLLRAHTGHDFALYKRNTLYRRIERRMGIHQINKMAGYVRYLQENSQELDLLFKELLIGVTNFFRDAAAWEHLRDQAIPALLASRKPGQTLRAWVAGCSTGEEAYSLAMVFREAVEQIKPRIDFGLQIFATDLDRDAIDKARQGCFPENIRADVSPERLVRFFRKEEHGYRVRKEIRETVIFAPHNLIMDPPFTKLDILTCRNLLIYLTPEVQKKIMPLFHYSLKSEGILFLGGSESIGSDGDLFSPLNRKHRIFRRLTSGLPAEPVAFPSSFSEGRPGAPEAPSLPSPPASLQMLADKLVLERYAPPAVLVNEKGDVLYISGRTGKYLEPAAGKANWNIFAMARETLRFELGEGFQKALRQKGTVVARGLRLQAQGGAQGVDLALLRLDDPGPLHGLVMIVFTDVTLPGTSRKPDRTLKARAAGARSTELQQELQRLQSETRATQEEMQTSQEELRSANEELQSTNEELQSTNEELTTSKEEMQSMNEELQTLNAELQANVEELSRASSDMKNLLESTDIATLFLDRELRVRRFTAQATKIIKLIPGDVGRPITDLVSDLDYPELAFNVREVLRTLIPIEKSVPATGGQWFKVRIGPYRALDERIDGVVITFADISVAKTLEAKLRGQFASVEKELAGQTGQSGPKLGKEPATDDGMARADRDMTRITNHGPSREPDAP